ncbi:hypothetical protein BJK06_16900 [Curtobacterium sp. BH-2-1-1]|nr:hypothetical protein BJK06_16900 [Curtobacterium sp. BH-2-1-1]
MHGRVSAVTVVTADRRRARITVDLGGTVCGREVALLEIGDQGPGGGWNVIVVVATVPVVTVPRPGFDSASRSKVLEVTEVSGIVFAPDSRQQPTRPAVAA